MTLHGEITGSDIHRMYAYEYADATARLAATGFVADDVGKAARQLDDDTLWYLTDDSPITWEQIGGAGSGVDSVNAQTGVVVLDPDDLDDTSTTHKFTTAAAITKLAGIATGATANSSDATLLARANHTGTQSADTLTDGTTNKAFLATERTKLSGIETAADVTDAANVAAAGAVMESDTSTAAMSFVVDEDDMASDSATKLPTQQSVKAYVDAGITGSTYTDEMARDALGAALVAGNNIDLTVNDGANTITIDVEALTSADLSDFTEAAQDATGAMIADTSSINLTYTDATPELKAEAIFGSTSGTVAEGDHTHAASYTDEQARDAIGASLVAGNNIDITVDDGANTITIDVETLTSGDVSDFNEAVDDRVSALVVAGNNVDVTYDDGAGTLTIDVEALTEADIASLVSDLSTLTSAVAGKQAADADLTTIAGLTATTDNVIQSVSSAWASRTPAQLKTTLALAKADVGLSNVDNTSDANKPVSTATQTALDLKAPIASPTFTGTVTIPVALTGVVRADSGVLSVDTDVTDIVAAATDTASGKIEIATTAETTTGTDAVRAVTPKGLHDMTSLAGAAWFLDEDAMTSNVDTKVPSQQSVKAYADTKQTSDATLTALAAYNTNGLLTQTAADTFAGRTITGTANQIAVADGNGVAGNPTLTLASGIDATKIAGGGVTSAEFDFLATVTSNVQTQIDSKAASGAALTEAAEANSTPVTDAASTAVGAATLRLYSFFQLPTTEKWYLLTGIEWKTGTTSTGTIFCGASLVDAVIPTLAGTALVAVGIPLTAAAINTTQRNSLIASQPIRGGSFVGVWVQASATTHHFRTATVSSNNNRKTITLPTNGVETAEIVAWTANTTQAYVKAYWRGIK